MLMTKKKYKFWFCTGSQDLYGDECLAHVAKHSQIIVDELNKSGRLPFELVWKPTLITNEVIRKTFNCRYVLCKRYDSHYFQGYDQYYQRDLYGMGENEAVYSFWRLSE